MFRLKSIFCALGAALLCFSPAFARDYVLGSLKIGDPWIRQTPPGAPTAAGYLTLTNQGKTADLLLGAASPDAGRVEVHRMTMTGQIMRMRPVEGGLPIGSGQTVTLAPGGELHLMLVAPKHTLKAGDRIPATLRFQKAGAVKITFAVRAANAQGPSSMPGMEMH